MTEYKATSPSEMARQDEDQMRVDMESYANKLKGSPDQAMGEMIMGSAVPQAEFDAALEKVAQAKQLIIADEACGLTPGAMKAMLAQLKGNPVFASGGMVPAGKAPPEWMPKATPNTKATNPKDGVGSLKPSYSAVPVPVLYELGAALTEGARKYGGYNWRVAGVRTSVYIDATRRHLDSFWEGEDIDPDSGLSHITKAIASLTVLRDAQIQGMVQNDDRPPSSKPFMVNAQARFTEIKNRYPNPKPTYTQVEVSHMRNTPVNIYAGQTLGYDLEVMLPADEAPEGFVWMQQGPRRTDLDLTLATAQALRDDGYSERVIRITMVSDRVEAMQNGDEYVSGESRDVVTTVFPGDPSLVEEESVGKPTTPAEDAGPVHYLEEDEEGLEFDDDRDWTRDLGCEG